MKSVKDSPKISDKIEITTGPAKKEARGGLRSPDGKPVDPKIIMKMFGVSLEKAKEISRRLSL